MNAHTFDSHSVTCPICNRADTLKSGLILGGLYKCPYCQERLVISWSGHYVRDPFTFRKLAVGQMLRRQSRPFARILRDCGLDKRSSLMGVLAGVAIAGIALATIEGWTMTGRNTLEGMVKQFTEVVESTIK